MAGKFPTSLVVGLLIGGFVGYAAGMGAGSRTAAAETEAALPAVGMPAKLADAASAVEAPASSVRTVEPEADEPAAAPAPAEPVTPPSDWVTQETVDAMTDKTIRFACATSSNSVTLDFPYGARSARICIRQHPKHGQDVYVTLSDSGQILCASYDGCTINVRFDDGEVEKFSANGPSDNSSETVFISNDSRFISAARKASRIRVQLEFFQNGTHTFDFPARGLKW